jgi:glycosyl transferase, family 25
MISKYVINLPSRSDRRVEMEEQLRRVGWKAQFSYAIRPEEADGFPSIGARGCYLSHLATLKRGLIDKTHVLIMEDDLDFEPGFNRAWNEVFADLQNQNWSMFYPAHYLRNQANGLMQLDPALGVTGAHFYMVHKHTVSYLIEGLETIMSRPAGHPLGGPMHVDGAYATIRKQNPDLIRTFVFSPALGHQRSSMSDIADKKFYDKIPALGGMLTALRKVKRSFSS